MTPRCALVVLPFLLFLSSANAQIAPTRAESLARAELVGNGYVQEDLADLVVKDSYQDAHNGMQHIFLRQRWQGVEVFNGDVALHLSSSGELIRMNNGAWPYLAKTAEAPTPKVSAQQALATVLTRDKVVAPMPRPLEGRDNGRLLLFDGSAFNGEPIKVQLMYQPTADTLRLVWNVNYYEPGGAHWWNVRVSAIDGRELARNDWVSNCDLGLEDEVEDRSGELPESGAPALAPAGSMEYRVYPLPVESPNHGSRSLVSTPWLAGGSASPYGWHDTNGATGAEYTITRGNNVYAKEDVAGNNGNGYAPDGGSALSFDHPINLGQHPNSYQDAAITNLFYWNNVMHDVWYQYGFDEQAGNFQSNNYGRGGQGGDFVYADAQDGSGVNNANFATPPDGNNPRMQMFLWNQTNPQRDGDLDAGIICHEYGHGISNRLVGGPSNVNCLNNAEQMGEGWSDFFGMMLTMRPSDTRTTGRGVGTYVIGEATNGTGIRPAPYSTAFSVNNYTYGHTNAMNGEHALGFVWCTILWEMTWDLIDQYGFDPDLYNGTGGNNLAMQLVMDGLKLTACSPGFVDGRDAILQADQINNAGANQDLLWAAFARRGLGYSASQGSSNSSNDQTEAFDMPLQKNIGVQSATPAGNMFVCPDTGIPVKAMVRNYGLQDQSGFQVRYSFDGGAYVTENFPGTLAAGATATHTFSQPVVIGTEGVYNLVVSTVLQGDEYSGDDELTVQVEATLATPITPTVEEGAENGTVPTGWTLENPDNSTTWTTAAVNNGPDCGPTTAWMLNYNTYSAYGQEDRLVTPPIDLSAIVGTHLAFDHAYARYNASYYDAFRVDVSDDCGASWATLYEAEGSDLATANDNTSSNWQPSNCNQWQAHEFDLSLYDGQSIALRFVGICGYGQRLYMDNIRVYSKMQRDIGVVAVSPAGNLLSCSSGPIPVTATLVNQGTQDQSGFQVRYSVDGGAYVTQTHNANLAAGATTDFTFTQPADLTAEGMHTLQVEVLLSGDQDPDNDQLEEQVNVIGALELPVEEGAENGTVPEGWTLENPDNSTTWTTATVNNGPLCASTTAWMINNYGYNATGQEDRLVTAPINLNGALSARLTFDHAYARYSANYYDAFRVDVSIDCGDNWAPIYEAEGAGLATAANNTSNNWQPSNCNQWQAHDLSLDNFIGHDVMIRFVNINGYGQRFYMDNIKVEGEMGVALAVNMFLGGPYQSSQQGMRDDLRANGQLPLTEPYTALGYDLPGGGGETTTAGILGVTGNSAVVDWVVVELRNANAPAQIVAASCMLLQRNGSVASIDGGTDLPFEVPAGSYHVAVRHRNHLGCMTADPVQLGGGTTPVVDFTSGTTNTWGTDARQQVGTKLVLWPGDVLADGQVKYTGAGNDREPILNTIGGVMPNAEVSGYHQQDVNMDGTVRYIGGANDRDALLLAVPGGIPNEVRHEQLP